jgi:hypothetical protein
MDASESAVSTSDDALALEALHLWDRGKHSALVVVSSSALISTNAMARLVEQVEILDLALPLVYGPLRTEWPANSLDKFYIVNDCENFSAHPLNVVRLQHALDSLPPRDSHENYVEFGSSFFEEGDSFPLSAVLLSPKSVGRILEAEATLSGSKPRQGLKHHLSKLSRSALDLNCGVVTRAFVYSNFGYENVRPAPYAKPTFKAPPAVATTLLAICAGIFSFKCEGGFRLAFVSTRLLPVLLP